MYYINKEARTFLLKHFTTIQNGFINDGLIHYEVFVEQWEVVNDVISNFKNIEVGHLVHHP